MSDDGAMGIAQKALKIAGATAVDSNARAAMVNAIMYNRLTSLAASAVGRNLVESRPLTPSPTWTPSTTYKSGDVVSNGGNLYVASASGTSAASGGPTTITDGDAHTDGTVYWQFLGGVEVTTVDANAPTYSFVTSLPADITSSDLRPSLQRIRLYGANYEVYAGNKWLMPVYNIGPVNKEYSKGSFIAFDTDAQKFAIEQVAGTPGIRVAINGRYYSMGALSSTTQGYHLFDLSAVSNRKVNHIVVDYGRGSTANGGVVGAVMVPARASIWKPSGPDFRAAFISDSIFDGTAYGPALPGNTVANVMARLLGWSDPWNFSKAGTGWLNTGVGTGSPYYTYRQRLPQVLATNPDILIFMDGINEQNFPPADVTLEVTATLAAARAQGFKGPMVVYGCWSVNITTLPTIEDAIAAGVAAYNDPLQRTFFIPIIRDPVVPWVMGAWNNSAAPGSINWTMYVAGDGIHPPELGTTYLGQRMAKSFVEKVIPGLLAKSLL